MAENYVLLERIELNDTAASVTFSNIPQSGYTDLKIVASARTTYGSTVEGSTITFNGSNTYSGRYLQGDGSSAASGSQSILNALLFNGATATANTFGNSEMYIPNYTGTTQKSVSGDGVSENNATQAFAGLFASLATLTSGITTITIAGNVGGSFVSGSTFSLYGLAAVGTTPSIAPKASGGNITTDGTYWIHTFVTSGTFTPATNLTCDYLIVAGGGSGGGAAAGGGGGGGLKTATSSLTSATAYSVVIGAGGAAVTNAAGNSGSDSSFNSVTSTGGGGGGGGGFANNAKSGGSGGGSNASYSNSNPTGGAASPSGQGYAGGSASGALTGGAGGGGAGAVGSSVTGANGGNGGAGAANSYSGSSTYYAGGGGGSGDPSGGSGGTGGGGGTTGKNTVTAGTVNTGGGGSASWDNSYASGAGGSGIVIIRYAMA